MKANGKRRTAIWVVWGTLAFCLLLLLVAMRELVSVVRTPAWVFLK